MVHEIDCAPDPWVSERTSASLDETRRERRTLMMMLSLFTMMLLSGVLLLTWSRAEEGDTPP